MFEEQIPDAEYPHELTRSLSAYSFGLISAQCEIEQPGAPQQFGPRLTLAGIGEELPKLGQYLAEVAGKYAVWHNQLGRAQIELDELLISNGEDPRVKIDRRLVNQRQLELKKRREVIRDLGMQLEMTRELYDETVHMYGTR
jgi:hypothetical protein